MERTSSIHIEKGNLGYCFHNTREKPTVNAIFKDAKNEYDNDALSAIEIYREELKKRTKKYTENTGKKLPKNTITHLSAIVNLDERHTLEDVKKVAKHLEKTLGTKVFQIAVHKDEGYIDENGEKQVNYHAHIEMVGLDENGKSVRKKLTRRYLIELQTKVAEILGMKRGINYTKERKKRPKRLGTYEYKEHARRKHQEVQKYKNLLEFVKSGYEREIETEKLKTKDVKKLISDIRNELKLINQSLSDNEKIFTKDDYSKLSKLKNKLNKDNVIEIYSELLTLVDKFNNKLSNQEPKIVEVEKIVKVKDMKKIKELEAEIERLKKLNSVFKVDYSEEIKELKNKLLEASQEKKKLLDRVKYLEKENETLKASNTQLKFENFNLKAKKKKLEQDNENLKSENKLLKERYTILEDKFNSLKENVTEYFKNRDNQKAFEAIVELCELTLEHIDVVNQEMNQMSDKLRNSMIESFESFENIENFDNQKSQELSDEELLEMMLKRGRKF